MPVIFLLAQISTGTDFSSLLTALNIGLAGIGLIAFVRGWIVPGRTYELEIEQRKKIQEEAAAERARLQAEINLLRENINEKFLPEIQRSRSVTSALTQLVDKVFEFIESQEESQ